MTPHRWRAGIFLHGEIPFVFPKVSSTSLSVFHKDAILLPDAGIQDQHQHIRCFDDTSRCIPSCLAAAVFLLPVFSGPKRKFHQAPPEVLGFGVITPTFTSARTRSSSPQHSWDCLCARKTIVNRGQGAESLEFVDPALRR